ncbi:MAG: winged helix DNA-binding protein [Alphaproteobacteria bacterium]|nr:winged helix DNA-binding protein [Alphaproteobacteria bacterium]
MLDLFSSHLRGKNVSVTSACLAANVPASTALRWMNVLEEAELIERVNDPSDGRRTFVQVTPNAIAKLTKALAESP